MRGSQAEEIIVVLFVWSACALGIMAGAHFLGSAHSERVARMVRSKEAYPREWDEEGADEFTASDMLILGEDGEQALFVPLTPWRQETEKFQGQARERMHIGVARVGDEMVGPMSSWYVQDWPVGKRVFRQYRALKKQHGEGFEGGAILHIKRVGERGSQATIYMLTVLEKIGDKSEYRDVIKRLTEQAYAG